MKPQANCMTPYPLPLSFNLCIHPFAFPGLASHHKDPYDRMLIAQAISEPLRLVTMDGVLSAYSELVIQV